MSSGLPPRPSSVPSPGSSCFKATGITCLVALLLGGAGMLWIYHLVMKVPLYRDYKTCCENMLEVGGALKRYEKRNNEYPSSLEQLSPSFLKDPGALHCPSDTRPKETVSYQYSPPPENAPPDTVVVYCKRHVLIQGRPPAQVALRKDGSLAQPYDKPFTLTGKPKPGE